MSVDLGAEFMKIAIVKPGVPMEIVLNKYDITNSAYDHQTVRVTYFFFVIMKERVDERRHLLSRFAVLSVNLARMPCLRLSRTPRRPTCSSLKFSESQSIIQLSQPTKRSIHSTISKKIPRPARSTFNMTSKRGS